MLQLWRDPFPRLGSIKSVLFWNPNYILWGVPWNLEKYTRYHLVSWSQPFFNGWMEMAIHPFFIRHDFTPASQEKCTCGKSSLKTENEQTKKQKVPERLLLLAFSLKKSLPESQKNELRIRNVFKKKMFLPKRGYFSGPKRICPQSSLGLCLGHCEVGKKPDSWGRKQFPAISCEQKKPRRWGKVGIPKRLFVCSAFSRRDHCFTENFQLTNPGDSWFYNLGLAWQRLLVS